MQNQELQLTNLKNLAKIIGVSYSTAKKWSKYATFPSIELCNRKYYRPSSVVTWLDTQEKNA